MRGYRTVTVIGLVSLVCLYVFFLLLGTSENVSSHHQMYIYARMPDLNASQVMACGSGSHELKRSRQPTLTFLWQPMPLYKEPPPETYHPSPTTLHLNIVLVGPYASCAQLNGALSSDDTKILGPKAVFISNTADDWTNRTIQQKAVVPAPGYYVFLEQVEQIYSDRPPFLNQYVTSLKVDP